MDSLFFALHEPGVVKDLKVVRGIRHGLAGLAGQFLYCPRPLAQQVDQFQSWPARKRLANPGQLIVNPILEPVSLVAHCNNPIFKRTFEY